MRQQAAQDEEIVGADGGSWDWERQPIRDAAPQRGRQAPRGGPTSLASTQHAVQHPLAERATNMQPQQQQKQQPPRPGWQQQLAQPVGRWAATIPPQAAAVKQGAGDAWSNPLQQQQHAGGSPAAQGADKWGAFVEEGEDDW